jgi:3-hydroxy-3-methylglutaryl CoA synthase
MKNKEYIKILKVEPINFNLKTILEKESILNSYKLFLKTCNFQIQILIQSNKEDLSKHFSKLEKYNKNENKEIQKYLNQYINFIKEFNKKRKSSSKNFYILIKEIPENKKEILKVEKILCENLNEKYFKIKECLSRCGNIVKQYEEKEEVERIIESFLNVRKDLKIV